MLALVVALLGGCGDPGVEAERDLLAARVAELERDNATLQSENTRLHAKLEKMSAQEAARAKAAAAAYETLGITEGQKLAATIQTSVGDIACELWPAIAPVTVTNFVQLSEGTKQWTHPETGEKTTRPLYDGLTFHRVMEGFMIQGGDPLGTGHGGPGYRFGDEVHEDVTFDRPGLLAMANAGPGTNGSQFFITDSQPTYLNGKHTIFGECQLEVVRKILAAPMHPEARGKPSRPVDPVVIEHIAITRG